MNLKQLISVNKSELSVTLLAFLLVFLSVLGSRSMRLNSGSAVLFEEETEIIFKERASLDQLINVLRNNNINFNSEELRWASRLLGWRNYQEGRYLFEGEYSYNSMMSKMARGIQDPVSVTILPGISPERLSMNLAEKLNFSATDFMGSLTDSLYLREKGWTKEDVFGRMLPETYLIYWTSGPESVRDKIINEFSLQVERQLGDQLEESELSLDEVLTMASIIEWEAYNEEEKDTISGLYWNRLERGMLLQADPTVNYAVGERRRLLFEDYQVEHPFNTYVNPGLPPAPITNPTLSSLEAALNPADHSYYYMVASPEGGHIFSRSFEEHKRNSEKWRKWIREQYRIKRQREQQEISSENSK